MKCFLYLALATLLLAGHALAADRRLSIERAADSVTIKVGGDLFTRYLVRSGAKPILWPLIGPTGKPMTRQYPLDKALPGEDEDHVHQRSLWFTHGNVDGIDFWSEEPGHGITEHKEFLKVEGGPAPVVQTRNDWRGPEGRVHCTDVRTLTFRADEDSRSIDFDIVLKPADRPVTFADTKEGSFGVRMAAGLTYLSRKKVPLGGHFINSHGHKDDDAWGKRAEWVDYYGRTGGDALGIAILNHPSSFRFPTYWHVRSYGLFAANPFGVHDFTLGKEKDGSVTLKPGQSLHLRYLVVLHKGNQETGRIRERFQAYSGHVAKAKAPDRGHYELVR